MCVLLLLCCCCLCLCNFQARPLNHAQSCILAPLAQKEVQVASPTDEWGAHTRTHSDTRTHTVKWHAFISLHDNCRQTPRKTTDIPPASRFLCRLLSFPFSDCIPSPACSLSPARFLFPDLHFNWFLSSVLKSLANVFGEHVFYANI